MNRLKISLLLLMSLLAGAAHAQESADDCACKSSLGVVLQAHQLAAASVALSQKELASQDISCFEVIIGDVDETLTRVSFVPRAPEDGNLYLSGENPCGRGVSYHIDHNNVVVRTVHSR